jgi:hypothetical protein
LATARTPHIKDALNEYDLKEKLKNVRNRDFA